ncbi:suppressor of tumorigenicity 14 protein homolog isoform X2 [Narcine bancroftii]
MQDPQSRETFLSESDSEPRKRQGKRSRTLVAVLSVLLTLGILAAVAGILYWYFAGRTSEDARGSQEDAVRIYSGHLTLTDMQYRSALEDPSSKDFQTLSQKLEEVVNSSCQNIPNLSPYFVKSRVYDYSDGTHMKAYYFVKFRIPPEDKAVLSQFSEDALTQPLHENIVGMGRLRSLPVGITSVSSSLANPDLVITPEERVCYHNLRAKDIPTRFTSPGFGGAGYPNNVHCQWVLRADRGHVLYLEFLDFNTDDDCGNDFVMVHDSLSPAEDDVITKKCGKRPSSHHLSILSSGSVMLVTLLTDDKLRYGGFSATFKQLLKMGECGQTLTTLSGKFTTPYYPSFYPPNIDCQWTIQVPIHLKIRIKFDMFRMEEPGARQGNCTKDYMEIEGQRYCGDHSLISLQLNSHEVRILFHSDESHTDKGFMGVFSAFSPSDPCPNEFTCRSGMCVASDLRCDGWNDCGDLSDEMKCNCGADQLTCDNGLCKPKLWFCDRKNDCGDHSDEKECACAVNQWKCADGLCIANDKACDGHLDCADGSDEAVCTGDNAICTDFNFRCADGTCVHRANAECDGQTDCADGSDENSCVPQCGTQPYKQNRIVGGMSADVGEWPWQISLHFKVMGHTCGASVISAEWLVSASHCFLDGYNDASSWLAYGGFNFQGEPTAQVRKISLIVRHPRYNEDTFDYDVALLRLEQPFDLRPKLQPICLPDTSHTFPSGKSCWVTGWGAMYEGGSASVSLQKAEVKIINQTVCRDVTQGELTSRMLCSGYLAGAIDACQGDSGGPLSCQEKGKWFLAGIVSWGEGCARKNKPGVYSRVTKLREWIREQTGL